MGKEVKPVQKRVAINSIDDEFTMEGIESRLHKVVKTDFWQDPATWITRQTNNLSKLATVSLGSTSASAVKVLEGVKDQTGGGAEGV